ncbi:SAM-dependent methyltransferase [Streptomyces griseus]|uniref:hypothetical protein n=1 Tax=Streptomyces griseus TaxID=1911 RepID=UPI00382F0446
MGDDDGDIVVMPDAHESFRQFVGGGTWIHWGACPGAPDEILISGHLDQVAEDISRTHAAARAEHGRIMDRPSTVVVAGSLLAVIASPFFPLRGNRTCPDRPGPRSGPRPRAPAAGRVRVLPVPRRGG